jgi:uncharacterized protein YhbP (UPF0306 family)
MSESSPDTSLPLHELLRRADAMLQGNQYLTLATADRVGLPWATTVWYCTSSQTLSPSGLGVELIWLSSPDARHSVNLGERPEVGISIFDSAQPAGIGDGLQFAARAELVPSDRLDEAAEVFSRESLAAGGGLWTRAQVEEPALPRLYVARIERAFVLGNGGRTEIPVT